MVGYESSTTSRREVLISPRKSFGGEHPRAHGPVLARKSACEEAADGVTLPVREA
jgi:hypothetical protein